ncbi:MAG: TonB family protein [Verrucomicrobia bacterium]|nr:TonB family protein [Verrucomicrobiota bacterium]
MTGSFLRAQNNSAKADFTRIVFSSISGPVRDALIYSPTPVIRNASIPRNLRVRGVFKFDLDNGIPYDVRVVQSTGYKGLDDAVVEVLRTWRFRPHRLVWATIPIEFRSVSSSKS